MTSDAASSGTPHQPENNAPSQGVDGEVRRLLGAGKCKQAVELAKDQHKRANTPESQRLLVEAYVARIEQFQSKGMAQEAQTLLTLVKQRFPSERHQLMTTEIRAAAASGRMSDLLGPLASDQTSPQLRALIEAAIRCHVTDLPAVAACDALPADHPLRLGAAAAWRAFEAVTTQAVTEADIALPEISHRSPLASWKLLIRAIAAFYWRDDAGCRRALDAIAADSAVAHLAATVRGLVDANKPASGIAAVLYSRVLSDDQLLRTALEKIENSERNSALSSLVVGIRDAIRNCASHRPDLLERLRQHIYVWCAIRGVPMDEVKMVLGSALKNAYFWRLLARGMEANEPPEAALYWERFLRHAIGEGMFGETSAEAATVWLHIGEVLSATPLEDLEEDREDLVASGLMNSLYRDQPPEIDALRPKSNLGTIDAVLKPGKPFEHAAAIRPERDTFRAWWAWAVRAELPDRKREEIALVWHGAAPGDALPLMVLSSLAEMRGALSLAVKRLNQAEAIDPLNPDVREARIRMTLSILWRHFADGKGHLVEKDLAALEGLPAMGTGDRPAVLEALRGAWHHLRGDVAAEAASLESVTARLGQVAGPLLCKSINARARRLRAHEIPPLQTSTAQPPEIMRALARVIQLGIDLNFQVWRPRGWSQIMEDVVNERPCPLSNSELLVLGRSELFFPNLPQAYQISSAGLARSDAPAITARFLLLRARSLTQPYHRHRAIQCLRIALELARQSHDEGLTREVFKIIDYNNYDTDVAGSGRGMSSDLLERAIANERRGEQYPRTLKDANSFLAEPPALGFGRRSAPDEFAGGWDDDDFDEEDEDDDLPFDSAPSAPKADADILDAFTPAQLKKLKELLSREGAPTFQEMKDSPLLLVEMLSEAVGMNLSERELYELTEQLTGTSKTRGAGPPERGPHGNREKRRKRRR